MPNFKKLLILGAKGNLGQQLMKAFADFDVTAWDREEVDLGNREELRRKILAVRPEVIINAVAYNNVDKAEEEPELARLINSEAVGWLAEIGKEIDAILVHYSTDYIFKGDKKDGYAEDDEPEPQSAYAKSKFLGEQKILAIQPKFYLIRTSRLFGPLASAVGAKPSFVDTILKLAKEKPVLEVVDAEVSSPTYTPDLARASRNLFYRSPTSIEGGIYHITNSGSCTWYAWAKKILELAKSDTIIKPVLADKFPRPAPRPAYSILLNTKLPPLRSWQEALADYLSYAPLEVRRGAFSEKKPKGGADLRL